VLGVPNAGHGREYDARSLHSMLCQSGMPFSGHMQNLSQTFDLTIRANSPDFRGQDRGQAELSAQGVISCVS